MARMMASSPRNPYADRRWACLGVSATGTFMSTLDGGIVNVALPTIAHRFNTDLPAAQWVVTIYLLVIVCLLPAFGRLGDMTGRKRKYFLGFLIFALSSALCGAAPGLSFLVAGRALQAVGAALLMANGPAIIMMSFPGHERGRALGMLGMVVSLGSLAGPSLGGLLVGAFGWPYIFYVNVPIGILGMFLVCRILPADKHPSTERFDFFGAAIYAVGIVSLVMGITHGGTWGWLSPATLGAWILAFGALAFFVRSQAKSAHPVIDPSLFRIRALTIGNIASFLSFMALLTNAIMLPFFLQRVAGLPPMRVGLIMAAQPLAMAFVAPFAGLASERVSHALLTSVGMALAACGLYSQTFLTADSTLTHFLLNQVILGLGFGVFLAPNNNAVLGSAPPAKSGIAGALMGLVRTLGMVTGIAAAAAVYQTFSGGAMAMDLRNAAAFSRTGFDAAMTFAAGLAVLGILVSLARGSAPGPRQGSALDPPGR